MKMTLLPQSLNAFGSAEFNQTLKNELCQLDITKLPLQQATTQGGIVDDKEIMVSIYSSMDEGRVIKVTMAIFFEEIVAGCSCGDPIMNIHNNCDLLLEINKKDAQAKFHFI